MTLKKSFRFAALLGLTLLSSSLVAQQTSSDLAMTNQHNLMPIPASVQFGSGKLSIDGGFRVALSQPDPRVHAATERFLKRLQGRTGLTFAATVSSDTAGSPLVVQFQGPGKSIPSLEEDESYKLEVTANKAQLTATTAIGAIRGLETVLQLVSSDRDGYFLPIVTVQDQPRFRWRGLLIDIGRHYEPPDVLKRNLDAMAAVKLNVFHWHLTEDQGFRIESKKFPKLHQLGSDGLFYTQEQAREIIEYARQRGIRVVPEFDIPGHSTSWLVGHPELGSAPGPFSIERRAGIFEPALDPTREEVYKFLDTFLGEMAALFPDEYLHIGGDENEGKQWDRNPKIQAFMKEKGIKDNHALQAYFNQRLLKILKKHKKKMIGWDEILQPEIPTSAVIHSWRGTTALAEAARKGYSGILSNGYYIDLGFPTSQHYLVDPIPADTTLTIEEQKRILGGEATMWGEYVGPETIDSRIWPRTAAIAERLWSPQNTRDVDDMYRRLNVITVQLEELGLTHERNVDVLLRRLVGQKEIGSLKLLVSQVEPVKEYRRGEQRASTMLSPLTGFVDAARPDSESARKIARMVDALLSDAPKFQPYASDLKTTFAQWSDAEAQLNPIVDRNPALHEIRPLTRDFSALGNAGLEALAYLSRNEAAPQDWFESKRTALDEAAKPKAALEFPVLSSVRALVVAAAELQQLKTMTPVDWKKFVITKATVTPTK